MRLWKSLKVSVLLFPKWWAQCFSKCDPWPSRSMLIWSAPDLGSQNVWEGTWGSFWQMSQGILGFKIQWAGIFLWPLSAPVFLESQTLWLYDVFCTVPKLCMRNKLLVTGSCLKSCMGSWYWRGLWNELFMVWSILYNMSTSHTCHWLINFAFSSSEVPVSPSTPSRCVQGGGWFSQSSCLNFSVLSWWWAPGKNLWLAETMVWTLGSPQAMSLDWNICFSEPPPNSKSSLHHFSGKLCKDLSKVLGEIVLCTLARRFVEGQYLFIRDFRWHVALALGVGPTYYTINSRKSAGRSSPLPLPFTLPLSPCSESSTYKSPLTPSAISPPSDQAQLCGFTTNWQHKTCQLNPFCL